MILYIKLAMQISVSLVTVIRNIHGIQERHAFAKYTTMDRCFNLEDLLGREGYESASFLILIFIGMHSVKSETECITTIGTVNSRLAHTLAMQTVAKITFLLQTVACLQRH